jgi:hypothetical protein
MTYRLYKSCLTGNSICNRPPEPVDVCSNLDEAIECFKDSFRHLLSRKPSEKQIQKIRNLEEVSAKSGVLTYSFQILT